MKAMQMNRTTGGRGVNYACARYEDYLRLITAKRLNESHWAQKCT